MAVPENLAPDAVMPESVTRPKVLVVDDVPANVRLMVGVLASEPFDIITAHDGKTALETIAQHQPDIVLLDIAMPDMSGIDVCKAARANVASAHIPIILVTALDPKAEMIRGLEAGADDFISKPFNGAELIARVKSLLRVKRLYDQVQAQAKTLHEWNQQLATKVAEQVKQVESFAKLQRFLPESVAQAVLKDDGATLASHRREICVVYLDLRGFTAFAERAEPEDIMSALSEYHQAMGQIAKRHGGTLERFTGDAIMVFLNDPIPIPNPAATACTMAAEMRDAARSLTLAWQRRGFQLGLGIGMAQGYATLGTIGFEGRLDYAAIGTVTNIAARLCDAAQANEILLTERIFAEVDQHIVAEPLGLLQLKGLAQPMNTYRMITFQMAQAAQSQPTS
jgi:adenylate cyclase